MATSGFPITLATASALALLAISSTTSGQTIVEFERNATGWLDAVGPLVEGRAFDEFYPGYAGSQVGCLVEPPGSSAVLPLSQTVLTVSAFDSIGAQVCPISDASTVGGQVSDGRLVSPGTIVLSFDPPVSHFYTFYGSLEQGHTVTMRLFGQGELLEEFAGPVSPNSGSAIGHGFISNACIDSIEFSTGAPDMTMIGAFVGLVPGEPSLGTVTIPGYQGPNGSTIELDFAVATGDLPPCCLANLNGDGAVDVGDLLLLLAGWGPCPPVCIGDLNGDGVVDVQDLLQLLAAWGPCP